MESAIATETVSLPGCLRAVFARVFQAPAAGSGWEMWQTALDISMTDARFLERLSIIQDACKKMRQEVDEIPAEFSSSVAKSDWLKAIDRLTSLTVPTSFHQAAEQWRAKASPVDVMLLENIHVIYKITQRSFELDRDEIKSLITDLTSILANINDSTLDYNARMVLTKAIDNLIYFLKNLEIFGFEAAWSASFQFAGSIMRCNSEFRDTDDVSLMAELVQIAGKIMGYLATLGGAKDGLLLIGAAAQLLLGGPPAF